MKYAVFRRTKVPIINMRMIMKIIMRIMLVMIMINNYVNIKATKNIIKSTVG